MTKSTRASILTVCTANVCRSPMAEFTLGDVFSRDPRFESVRVGSAGVRPAKDSDVCDAVAARQEGERWSERVRAHRPSGVTPHKLAQARLILTASRSSRSTIARLAPEVRERTFTMNEALILGAGYRREGEIAGVEAVSAFAAYLDTQRGLQPLVHPRRRFPWSRVATDPLNIFDGHNAGSKAHAATVREVDAAMRRLAALIIGSPASAREERKRVGEPA